MSKMVEGLVRPFKDLGNSTWAPHCEGGANVLVYAGPHASSR